MVSAPNVEGHGLNSTEGGNQLVTLQHFIAQNLSLSPFCVVR